MNVGRTPSVAQSFYQQYLLSLIQDVFAVITDRLHKSGFKMHATLLRMMFHLVQMNQVTVPLFDTSQQPPGTTNPAFLRTHISNLLFTSFPNLSRAQVSKFVEDFLIELKEFSSEDNTALFSEEQEHDQRLREQTIMAERSAVPGILKPSEIDNDL
jgi:exportin-1